MIFSLTGVALIKSGEGLGGVGDVSAGDLLEPHEPRRHN